MVGAVSLYSTIDLSALFARRCVALSSAWWAAPVIARCRLRRRSGQASSDTARQYKKPLSGERGFFDPKSSAELSRSESDHLQVLEPGLPLHLLEQQSEFSTHASPLAAQTGVWPVSAFQKPELKALVPLLLPPLPEQPPWVWMPTERLELPSITGLPELPPVVSVV